VEKISGLKLDVHDDADGEVLKSIFPDYEQLPELLKSANQLTGATLEQLPDDVFALVLHDGDNVLRKYACVDEGNTALSVEYFLKVAHKLPVEAQKVAAENLITACHWYDIEPPEDLKKLSTGEVAVIGRQRIWKDMDGSQYGHNDQSWEAEKTAEVVGTSDMPLRGAAPSKDFPTKGRVSVIKNSSADDVLAEAFGVKQAEETSLVQEDMPTQDNPPAAPQVKKTLSPHVDVTSKEPPTVIEEKQASYYAMPSIGRYPIDTYGQVKTADLYFQDHWKRMEPVDRREYCHNLVKRAAVIGQPLSESVKTFGQEGFAKVAHILAAIDARKLLVAPHAEQGTDECTKVASVNALKLYDDLMATRERMDPEVFAETLAGIDKVAGIDHLWDGAIYDPYYSTFAKVADDSSDADPKDSVVIGNEYMKVQDLLTFANSKPDMIKVRFGDDFTSEFQKDPKAIFDSLPQPQKLVIMRLVNNSHSMSFGASAS